MNDKEITKEIVVALIANKNITNAKEAREAYAELFAIISKPREKNWHLCNQG